MKMGFEHKERHMKKKVIGIVLSLVISSIVGCGSSSSADSVTTTDLSADYSSTEAEDVTESDVSSTENVDIQEEEATTQESKTDQENVIGKNDISEDNLDHVLEFDDSFDVYGYYEPKAEILSAGVEHPMLQIGDSVLEIGKSTYNDFAHAGVTVDDTELEKEVTGLYSLKLYIGDNIVMETQHRGADISEKLSIVNDKNNFVYILT